MIGWFGWITNDEAGFTACKFDVFSWNPNMAAVVALDDLVQRVPEHRVRIGLNFRPFIATAWRDYMVGNGHSKLAGAIRAWWHP